VYGESYYRARYYDPSVGRFLSEDIWGNEERTNLYQYVGNNPVDWIDPLGQYTLVPDHRPGHTSPLPPSPRLDKLLTCMENCYGQPIQITSTSEPSPFHAPGTPHRRGEAADIREPANPSKLLCCASQCGAGFGLDEGAHPSRPGVAAHVHVQFTLGTHPEKYQYGPHGDMPPKTCAGCK
jgi:hypothetical protein